MKEETRKKVYDKYNGHCAYCGECDKFLYEDTDGFGYCNVTRREKRCDDKCNLNTKNSYGKDNK